MVLMVSWSSSLISTDGGDLHFEVGRDGCSGQPRFWERCPLLWSGCRLTHGTHQGRVGFEAMFEKKLVSPSLDSEDPEHHGLRLGWSVERWNSNLMLGKDQTFFPTKKCANYVDMF